MVSLLQNLRRQSLRVASSPPVPHRNLVSRLVSKAMAAGVTRIKCQSERIPRPIVPQSSESFRSIYVTRAILDEKITQQVENSGIADW